MLALVLVPPTAFVAPSRSTIVVPARAAVRLESERPETEMEYLKRQQRRATPPASYALRATR